MRVRYGYRRVHVLLDREGWGINIKTVYRIYNELGMQLRNKTPKRCVKAKLRDDRVEAVGPNDVWAMDFVHDGLATGKKMRVLTVVDTFSRYVPVLDARFVGRCQDGDPRVPILTKGPASSGHFAPEVFGTSVDCQAVFLSPLAALGAWQYSRQTPVRCL